MREVAALRAPLLFGRAPGTVTLSEGGEGATRDAGYGHQAAAGTVAMRSGRHFAQFMVMEGGSNMFLGVIRPGWDVEGGESAFNVDAHCFYRTYGGHRCPSPSNWEGRLGAIADGDCIGMLLDLDQGSMTVWKNGEKLGVMVAEGLSGTLCWAVSLYDQGEIVRIASPPAHVPASPTEEELDAVKGFVPTATDAECEAQEPVEAESDDD